MVSHVTGVFENKKLSTAAFKFIHVWMPFNIYHFLITHFIAYALIVAACIRFEL